ncbi:MAG: aldolase/citrate lyase family protein [Microcella sp.]|uniref:HpcH/HpaI aldolase family protein n=1 Tax=Microcella sp. TaxID=1913979 RepID=UPI003315874A
MRDNPVKKSMLAGEMTIGTMLIEFNTSGIAQLAANAGAEWVLYDMEHSGWSVSDIRQSMSHARASGVVPLIRPPATQYHLLSGPLDVGAMGVMVPMVESAEQARAIVESCKYPPLGKRGAVFGVAHDDYSAADIGATIRSVNSEVLCIAQIETPDGVANAHEIAAVDGIDALWVGHFDLSNFLGIPGQFDHPDFLDAIATVIEAARASGKVVGILAGSVDEARLRVSQGFGALLYGLDSAVYGAALQSGISSLKESLS